MTRALPTLHDGRVSLRPLAARDVDYLAGVIAHAEVARWWGPRAGDREHSRNGLLEDVAERAAFAIEVDGALAGWLVDERGHHRLTIDPAAANERAIGVYARLGFRPVGVMRDYERGPDGAWRDGLLMDVLAHELS